MNKELLIPVVLSVLRHLLGLVGGAALVTKHDSELASLAGFLVALVPVLWGAWNAKQNQKTKAELASEAEAAKSETVVLKKQLGEAETKTL